ncbi:MAG TPA: GNAT family N-acetyltransferase [Desulfitobacterium dehalogenans]|uniref:GNAT family N-acetyltransferase n=1 Tax=Desulfitobacterium dehalogenans TaxID=36854 RepID=A0A7C7D7W4_9FIRM|nr:GNAT family N-acetyltransferase [Desulfitobacterium dehalogenans]
MSEVIVRLCETDDLPGVVTLMNELREVAQGEEVTFQSISKVFSEMERLPEVYLNVVAEISGKVVGFISVIFYRTVFHKGGTALINELIITQAERGKGIGKRLVLMAHEEALKRGFDEIEVGTEKTNVVAQKFYRRCGFNEEYVLLGMEFE